jgi:hypothetical protein
MRKRVIQRLTAALILAAAGGAMAQSPATTAFTYQGRLTSGGVAQSVPFDFRFKLFDAASAGNQLGSTLSVTLGVSGGLFTTSLDFGLQFDGSRRWLEIAVRPSGNGNFTTLTPRQEITAAPHASGLVLPISATVNSPLPAISVVNTNGDGIDPTGVDNGVSTFGTGQDGNGLFAECDNGTDAFGVWGRSNSGLGVVGDGDVVGGSFRGNNGPGVQAFGTTGVEGTASVSTGFGVHGIGGPGSIAVMGESSNGGINSFGLFGISTSPGGNGVRGEVTASGDAFGVWGVDNTNAPGNFAGWFDGSVNVTGNLSKGGGSFKIDHPLDPANQYLYHSFVESPDMMNIYNGNASLDGTGSATITMPVWFETLNRDFRYSLTAVGAPSPNLYIAQTMQNGHFVISGGTPGATVSWTITGIRQDPWANAHRIPVEEMKRPQERGLYLHPELYGMPQSASITAPKSAGLTRPAAAPGTHPQKAAPTPPVMAKGGN